MLQNTGDGSSGRRKKKAGHQADSPDLGKRLSYHEQQKELSKSLNRLAFAVRMSRGWARKCAFRVFKLSKEAIHRLGHSPAVKANRKRPRYGIGFVKAKKPDNALGPIMPYSRPTPKRLVPRLRYHATLKYDIRVAGTFLEAPSIRHLRRCHERASVSSTHCSKPVFPLSCNGKHYQYVPEHGMDADEHVECLACHTAYDPVIADSVLIGMLDKCLGVEWWSLSSNECLPPFLCSVPKADIDEAVLRCYKAASGGIATLRQRSLVLENAWDEMFSRLENLKHWVPVVRDPALDAAGWYGLESW